MKCPMSMAMLGNYSSNVLVKPVECLKEECAWWGTYTVEKSTESTGCCIAILPEILSEIMYKMGEK